jgi:hypothetical protein
VWVILLTISELQEMFAVSLGTPGGKLSLWLTVNAGILACPIPLRISSGFQAGTRRPALPSLRKCIALRKTKWLQKQFEVIFKDTQQKLRVRFVAKEFLSAADEMDGRVWE